MPHPTLRFRAPDLADFCRRHHVRSLALFGSATREDFRDDSDVDVLLEFEPDAGGGLQELVDMRDELSALFGRRVDIATPEILRNPYRRREILKDLEILHGA